MITQRMGSQSAPMEYWQFTVNTEAITAGAKKTGIPFSLYQQVGTLLVDWGDGTTSSLTSSDYTYNDALASVHEYNTAGIYTITISSKNWKTLYIGYTLTFSGALTSNNQLCLRYFYETLVTLDNEMPEVIGAQELSSSGRTNRYQNFYGVFSRCRKLQTVPIGFFSKHTGGLIVGYSYAFAATQLLTVPADLFSYNTDIVYLDSCLFSGITDVELYILSEHVGSASGFLSYSTSYNRIIHVKPNTTTESTFNNIATRCGLTVVSDIPTV